MNWVLLFVLAFMFYWGLCRLVDHMLDKAAADRAEKRAKEHFKQTERFRRSIG